MKASSRALSIHRERADGDEETPDARATQKREDGDETGAQQDVETPDDRATQQSEGGVDTPTRQSQKKRGRRSKQDKARERPRAESQVIGVGSTVRLHYQTNMGAATAVARVLAVHGDGTLDLLAQPPHQVRGERVPQVTDGVPGMAWEPA